MNEAERLVDRIERARNRIKEEKYMDERKKWAKIEWQLNKRYYAIVGEYYPYRKWEDYFH